MKDNLKKKLLAARGPIYFGGLLIGLAAGVGFWKLKKAMMPKFHEAQETRDEVTIAPGGSVRFTYSEDPGYFLIPGLPSGAILYRKNEDGSAAPLMNLRYGNLVDKDPTMGPLTEEGKYFLDADFYICAEPGVADCMKLTINQEIKVERGATIGEDRVDVDLPRYGQEGLKSGNLDDKRNQAGEMAPEKSDAPPPPPPKED